MDDYEGYYWENERLISNDKRIRIFKIKYTKPHPLAGQVNNTWYCNVKVTRGKEGYRGSTGEVTLRNAIRYAEAKVIDVQSANREETPIKGVSFSYVGQQYINRLKIDIKTNPDKEKYIWHRDTYNNVLKPYYGKKRITSINTVMISDQNNIRLRDRQKRAVAIQGGYETVDLPKFVSPTTVNKENQVLRAILNFAVLHKRLKVAPKINALPEPKAKSTYFTYDEWKHFHKYLTTWHLKISQNEQKVAVHYRRMFADWAKLIVLTGLRTGEASALRFNEIDIVTDIVGLKRGFINVTAIDNYAEKTGPRRIQVRVKPLVDIIDRIRTYSDYTDLNDYVFTHPARKFKTCKKIKKFKSSFETAVTDCFGDSIDASGNHRTPYSLRHTYANLFLKYEEPNLYKLAKQMGNSVKVCEDYYDHLRSEDLDIFERPSVIDELG